MPGSADVSPPISLPFHLYLGAKDLHDEADPTANAVEIARRNHRLAECTENIKRLLHSVNTLRSLDWTGHSEAAAEHLDYAWATAQGQLSGLTLDVRRAAERYRAQAAAKASSTQRDADPTPGTLGIEPLVNTNTRDTTRPTPADMAGKGNRK